MPLILSSPGAVARPYCSSTERWIAKARAHANGMHLMMSLLLFVSIRLLAEIRYSQHRNNNPTASIRRNDSRWPSPFASFSTVKANDI